MNFKRKKYLALIILILIFFASGVHTVMLLRIDPKLYSKKLKFIYPYRAITDTYGNTYFIDNFYKRVVKLDKDSHVIFSINGGTKVSDFFYTGNLYFNEKSKTLFVPNYADALMQVMKIPTEILAYNEMGELIKKLSITEFSNKQAQVHNIINDYIYYIESSKDEKEATLIKVNYNNPVDKTVLFRINQDELKSMNSFLILENKVIFTLDDNKIYEIDYATELINEIANLNRYGLNSGEISGEHSNRIYLINQTKTAVYYIENGEVILFADRDSVVKRGFNKDQVFFRELSVNEAGDITTVNYNNNRIYTLTHDFEVKSMFAEGHLSIIQKLSRNRLLISLLLCLISLVILIKHLYINIFQKKVWLFFKILAVIFPLTILLVVQITLRTFFQDAKNFEEMFTRNLMSISQTIAEQIDGDSIEMIFGESYYSKDKDDYKIKKINSDNIEAYSNLRETVLNMMSPSHSAWNENMIPVFHIIHGQDLYFVGLEENRFLLNPIAKLNEKYLKTMRDGESNTFFHASQLGELAISIYPIKDSDDKTVAIFGIYTDGFVIMNQTLDYIWELVGNIAVIFVVHVVILVVLSYNLMKPVRQLTAVTKNITEGNFDTKANIKTSDEIGELGRNFNQMTEHINRYIYAQGKFVPKEFLDILDKDDIRDLELGIQVKKKMTILFCDIRSFTTISEKMTAQENFDFINEYLSNMAPSIHNNKGFIDKFIGDAIMALFYANDNSVINASIQMIENLDKFNIEREIRGLNRVRIGIGLHTGDVMLGIVGEENRYNVTVISDNVNLASRTEGMTKLYGAEILITDETKDIIDSDNFKIRTIDRVVARGRSEVTTIYEVITRDKLENDWVINFEEAIKLYFNKEFHDALIKFERLNAQQIDKVSQIYIERCKKLLNEKLPENWNGVFDF